MNSIEPDFDDTPPWTTTLSLSFGESDVATGMRLAPGIRWRFREPEGAAELELRYEDMVQSLVRSVANTAIHASDGDRSLARIARWEFSRDGERVDRGEGSVVLRPLEGDVIGVDVVAFDDPGEASVGRLDPSVEIRSSLPDGPVPVRFDDVLTELVEAGNETLAMYKEQEALQSESAESLRALVRDVETALDAADGGAFGGFDTSLERYEDLFLENPTATTDIHGPIQDEWLVHHALETDVIERLLDERIRAADTETARRWYKALFMVEDEITDRTLDVLATDPDQRAIGGLLLFVWDDDPLFAPQAVSILGSLLAAHETFEETREDRQYVLEQVANLTSESDHASVRTAATEALERLEDGD